MTSSLVGSEMCIRDSDNTKSLTEPELEEVLGFLASFVDLSTATGGPKTCLLYTSDAADDM
eukprot:7993854-Prorocentrum_lima.AAC.1